MYKVVTEELKSIFMREDSGLQIQYKIDEFVQPHESLLKLGYGLCVFGSLDEALEYHKIMTLDDNLRIFKCEVQELSNPQPKRFPVSNDLKACFDAVINDKIPQDKKLNWFEGTILVSAVKLVEEINV